MKIGVISNPRAGKVSSSSLRRFDYFVGSLHRITRDEKELDREIDKLLQAGVDPLLIHGGDGTLHFVLTRIFHRYGENCQLPSIALLNGGTTNVVGQWCGWSAKVVENYFKIVNGTCENRVGSVIRVWQEGKEKPIYGFVFLHGGLARLVCEAHRGGHPTFFKSFWVAVRAVIASNFPFLGMQRLLERVECPLEVDGCEVLPKEHLHLVASSVDRLIFGMRPFHHSSSPDKFLLIAYNRSQAELGRNAFRYLKGKISSGKDFLNAQAVKAEFSTCQTYVLDGEIFAASREMRRLTLTVGPKISFLAHK